MPLAKTWYNFFRCHCKPVFKLAIWHLIYIHLNGSEATKHLGKSSPRFFSYLNPWSINKAWKTCAAVLWPFSRLGCELCGPLKIPQS